MAQGTAFSYQGQLAISGAPATGSYDMTFTLDSALNGGSVLAGPITNMAVAVTNGSFMVQVDFGPGVFTGGTNWLSVGVRTNGSGTFNPLLPRQQITPNPYALTAGNGRWRAWQNALLPSSTLGDRPAPQNKACIWRTTSRQGVPGWSICQRKPQKVPRSE